ncbi:M24 family metallopeptidase [Pseudoclavibacter chungangensis]|uniref:M24 family metallopeptidase n=1 Tax=Pseudoclavibacter chungangensis TaxID=587635 RepID=A0A7J5BMS2_9MICO|nr:M24 family metallopeptidase [Pseudoclavibacter chungangensis]KAB1652737.1 M24 family metallopeptidase [Pseudoclavibacter chungangensis]NYJ68013.1 Xaa-Pro aminopeptidase [Pseudoclavibacter chungangensis]
MGQQVEDGGAVAPFTAEEYAARQQRVREAARERGFDALLIADPANLYYLTGYNAWSFYMPQVLHLPVEGRPTLLMREMDANGAHRTAAGIPAEDVLGYPETLVHHTDVHPGDWIAQRLRERGHATAARVGYEGEAHFFSVRTFLAIGVGLPEWTFVESNDVVNWVRLVKTPGEIELMRAAGLVASAAMRAGLEAIAPGRAQNEVAAEILAAQARGVPGADGDYPAIVPMLPVGEGADTPHLTWTNAPLRADEPVSIELAGVHRRYHAPLARTAIIGTPSSELDRLAGATVEGLDAALAAVRPGVTAHDVTAAFTRVIEAAGFSKNSRLGYSIGIGYPPDWGERTVSIRADDPTVLAEHMTFHLIAGMWMTGYGFEVSESVHVTADGVETLTDVARELITIDAGRTL